MKTLTIIIALLCICTTPSAAASATKKPASTKKTSAPKAGAVAPVSRTLDAIRIEGEIDVPQVLFITARDYRRFRDGAPQKYQTTSADVAKTIPLPNRVRMVAPAE